MADDIESLNQRSESGELDITAMSVAQYPRVLDVYALTACGASVGDGYGPKLVTRHGAATVESLRRPTSRIAIPGQRTTAALVLNLLLGKCHGQFIPLPFEEIIDRVVSGEVDAGVVIHEGQLTYERAGLALLVDLGAWWMQWTQLPLPLGANALKRDLDDRFGDGTAVEVASLLSESVAYALEHRSESIQYAATFARGLDTQTVDAFVAMYVNRWTLDYGEVGERAVRRLLAEASAAGLLPGVHGVEFIRSGGNSGVGAFAGA